MKDAPRKELIGKEIKVIEAENEANTGIEGRIIDETRNMLVIETKNGVKKLVKKNITIMLKDERLAVKGSLLVARPEDRIKKK